MKIFNYTLCAVLLLSMVACKKDHTATPEEPATSPAMTYFDLSGKSVSLGQLVTLDFDGDSKSDVHIGTQSVADNINNRVKDQYRAGSSLTVSMIYTVNATNGEDELIYLTKGENVSLTGHVNASWYNGSSAVLVQHVENTINNQKSWEGNWAGKGHQYLAFKLVKNSLTYYGWIELEADTLNAKIVLYKAAMSKEADKAVKAGV